MGTVGCRQGGQIGIIFAYWVGIWEGLKITEIVHFGGLLFPRKKCVWSFNEKWVRFYFG
jgi:hypothetical protein